jgi:hypothetical protein
MDQEKIHMKAQSLEVSPDELRPNKFNCNVMSPEQELKLEGSLNRFDGLFKPILVREVLGSPGYEILGGEHRWLVAKKQRLETIPIWNLGIIPDKLAKEISLVDNTRYGADDTLALSEFLKELGDSADIQSFLPYSDVDIQAIFSASDIALDELELEEFSEDEKKIEEPPATKAPKTHTIMRFKISLEDAERLTKLIASIQIKHGYTASDQITNAGDALVHLLLNGEFEETDAD